ncbi:MAG: ATP-binding cassette domain-containing protein [Pseudomonadota bacterium]
MRDTAEIAGPGLGPTVVHCALLPCRLEAVRVSAQGRALLDGVDLTLAGRGITVVMGPNGAGKSLLLRVMHGLVQPDSGTVRWGDAAPDEAIRRRQALVFQKPVLLRRTVAANIDFVQRARGRRDPGRREALLAHMGLAEHAQRPARLLSGGEQQRLALARALALDPEVLLLDEPTASLDPASVQLIEESVRGANAGGVKIVFVTHDVGQARRLADDVVFLHRGRIAEHGPADAFLSDPQSEAARAYLAGRLVI